MKPRLVTIPISHYCERARWALDHAGVDYDEEQHLQVFSRRVTRRLGGGTVPVLVLADRVLADSGEIVRFASEQTGGSLYPTDQAERAEAERLERELSGELGVESRRIAYSWFLRIPGVARYNAGRAPRLEAAVLRVLFPLAGSFIARKLQVTPEKVERGMGRVDRVFDEIAERLSDGRPYLAGERFGAVDLTFAALAAPCVVPAEYGTPLPGLEALPPEAAARVRAWREHPAGRFALRMYRQHRARSRPPRA